MTQNSNVIYIVIIELVIFSNFSKWKEEQGLCPWWITQSSWGDAKPIEGLLRRNGRGEWPALISLCSIDMFLLC